MSILGQAARASSLARVSHGGHGPWLVMVIGRGATMAEWDPQLIAQLIRNHRVLVFDNRGIGTTNNTSTQTPSIQQMAHDTLALASALHIKRFDLMGWSMGTYISQQATLDAPKRIRRLVLCATDPGGTHYVKPIVLWGNLDLLVPPKNDRIVVGRIPHAHGVVFKGAGHAFLFQDAVSVGRTIDKFLS